MSGLLHFAPTNSPWVSEDALLVSRNLFLSLGMSSDHVKRISILLSSQTRTHKQTEVVSRKMILQGLFLSWLIASVSGDTGK